MHDDHGALSCDVLVVGAGPTGLALAAQVHRFGASVLVVDSAPDQARESRALGIQPRTLEVLAPLGLAEELVARGNPAVRLRMHARSRARDVRLFDLGMDDTAYPFLLFLSQSETEAVLAGHLAESGVRVERGTRVDSLREEGSTVVAAITRAAGGPPGRVRARYVVGCDGAHSTVREQAGIPFAGGRYPQTFLLADLEASGLEPGVVHAFLTASGPVLFFPLGHPASWRLITMRPSAPWPPATRLPASLPAPGLGELQGRVDQASDGQVRLAEPVWASAFGVHHRHAASYRRGRVFLAGDAAHIHSPAGGQGMNTGIQDAVNLGWKLGLVLHGAADPALLDTYDAERRPVGDVVLRFTDRAFTLVVSPHPVLRLVREHVAPRALPVALRVRRVRRVAFRTVSQLAIRYRHSPATAPGGPGPRPRPGDRLPDAMVRRDGEPASLHAATRAACFHLLLCGSTGDWASHELTALQRLDSLLRVQRIVAQPEPGALHDVDRIALARLAMRRGDSLLVRPDGHVASRSDRFDLGEHQRYLERWLPRSE